MLKVYICEDNKKHREKIEKIIKDNILIEDYDVEIKLVTDKPLDILKKIDSENETGIYFLDVDLNTEINGIELASKIREIDSRGFIIFITTHGEMSYLTFKYKVEAMDYIVKEDLKEMSSRVNECFKEILKRYSISQEDRKVFVAKSKDRIIRMEYKEIMFFETSQTIHKIKLHGLNRQVEFYGKMKELEKELEDDFIRTHSSYLVNKEMIKEIDKGNRILKMSNGELCLISDKGMKMLKSFNFY